MNPLATVRLVTKNRRLFARNAIKLVKRQTYRPIQLVVVDAGDRPLGLDEHALEDECGFGFHVDYVRVAPTMSIGACNNIVANRTSGDYIIHVDDDDWQSPRRVEKQMAALVAGAEITHSSTYYMLHVGKGCRLPVSDDPANFAHGALLAYRKSIALEHAFPHDKFEDAIWVRARRAAGAHIVDTVDTDLVVYVLHGNGAAGNEHLGINIDGVATNEVQALMGDDWKFYEDLADVQPKPSVLVDWPPTFLRSSL